jgi:hypothetical protein
MNLNLQTTYLWHIEIRTATERMLMRVLGTRGDAASLVLSYRPPGQESWITMTAIDQDPSI